MSKSFFFITSLNVWSRWLKLHSDSKRTETYIFVVLDHLMLTVVPLLVHYVNLLM